MKVLHYPKASPIPQTIIELNGKRYATIFTLSRILTDTTGETGHGIFSQGSIRFIRGTRAVTVSMHWGLVNKTDPEAIEQYIEQSTIRVNAAFRDQNQV